MTARIRLAPVLGMRALERVDGERYLVAVLDADLTLEAGTELHLVRITDDDAFGPTHALRIFAPDIAPTQAQLATAAGDRLDGGTLRRPPTTAREGGPA